ncbi:MAG: aminotransferase class III-fold pyridoxal phosphate-dependent enzyme, partial [Pseudomonadota bacterium]|nr:aminotransferase class III-fold pyridoxal phosphate-dependent enzyme [Pseudomonadota bacterium]
ELRSHPTVGDVRGLGLICGLEIVKDGATKEKFSESGEELKALADNLHDRGLLTRAASIISLSPPLCISADEVDRIIDILDGAIGDMEDKFGLR